MSATLTQTRPPLLMTASDSSRASAGSSNSSNSAPGMGDRPSSLKGKKRARSEYEHGQEQQQTGGSSSAHLSAPSSTTQKVNSARTRGVLLAFVDKALANARLGDKRDYNELLAQFQNATPARAAYSDPSQPSASTSTAQTTTSPQQIKSWLDALVHAVSQLDDRHKPLVEAIASLPWTTYEESVRKSFVRFQCVLAAARPEHLKPILQKAVASLRWDTPQIHISNSQNGSNSAEAQTSRRQIYDRMHHLLRALLDNVPTLAPTLLATIERLAPPRRHKREAQVAYFQNVLRLVEYCPQLCEDVLQSVISRAIKLDVEIQIDLEEWEDESGELDREVFGGHIDDVLDAVPHADDDASEADSESEAGSDSSIEDLSDIEESADDNDDDEKNSQDGDAARDKDDADHHLDPKVVAKLQRNAAKLDALLKMLFVFLTKQDVAATSSSSVGSSRNTTPTSSRPTSPRRASSHVALQNAAVALGGSPEQRRQNLFECLLNVFDSTILRAFKTRHTQFLLFWYASVHRQFADKFVGTLLHRVVEEEDKPAVVRMAAASYLASLLSRANFIENHWIKEIIGYLCTWLDDQLHLISPSPASSGFLPGPHSASPPTSPGQYAMFYAVTQSVLYMFCYRWKDLLLDHEEDDEADEDMLLDSINGGHPSGRKWIPELQVLKKVITSSLNPLKMCTPMVVGQFVKIAAHVDFCWCHHIVEANNRRAGGTEPTTPLAMPLASLDNPNAASNDPQVLKTLKEAEVETHFPFEPYKLPLTKPYIDGIYMEFEAPEGMEEDEATEDEDADEGDETDLSVSFGSSSSHNGFSSSSHSRALPIPASTRRKHGSSANQHLGTSRQHGDDDAEMFSKSFEAMSISPARM